MVSTTRSANPSRAVSQPPRNRYGAYCAVTDMRCVPGGASEGSAIDGMVISSHGFREYSPYFEASNARSM
jgi:hypothetical protein